jgi:AN1-type zinc finger protein 1
MEFDIGKHCSLPECNMLDYCPFLCQHCAAYHCLKHRMPDQHKCKNNPITNNNNKIIKNKKRKKTKMTVRCDVCRKKIKNYVGYPFKCSQCDINVCEEHRLPEYHECPWLKTTREGKKESCTCF